MTHKIAIRYCGGCNPRYDRRVFTRRLQEQSPSLQMNVFDPREEYLAALVVCGCAAQCVGQRDLPERLPRFVAAAPEDYERAVAFLNETAQKENVMNKTV